MLVAPKLTTGVLREECREAVSPPWRLQRAAVARLLPILLFTADLYREIIFPNALAPPGYEGLDSAMKNNAQVNPAFGSPSTAWQLFLFNREFTDPGTRRGPRREDSAMDSSALTTRRPCHDWAGRSDLLRSTEESTDTHQHESAFCWI
jgi:hypothetical protein